MGLSSSGLHSGGTLAPGRLTTEPLQQESEPLRPRDLPSQVASDNGVVNEELPAASSDLSLPVSASALPEVIPLEDGSLTTTAHLAASATDVPSQLANTQQLANTEPPAVIALEDGPLASCDESAAPESVETSQVSCCAQSANAPGATDPL